MNHAPSYTALKVLEALVRCGSVARAAADLCVSEGAVSQQVRNLEKHMDLLLFDRSSRSMVPTREAVELARELRKGFDLIEAAVVRTSKQSQATQLKVATLPSIASRFLIPNLATFKNQHPEIQLNFSYIHRIDDTDPWDIDVLVCAADGPYPGQGKAYRLFDGKVYPFATPALAKELGHDTDYATWHSANLLHDFSKDAWREWLSGVDGNQNTSLSGDTFEDFELMVQAAISGQGVALCPPQLLVREIELGVLQQVSNRSALKQRTYYVVHKKLGRPEAEEFMEWITRLPVCSSGH